MNRPIWLPMAPSSWSSAGSGGRISRLKNSITPRISPSITSGKPNAARSPSRAAISARGKFTSSSTSGIHAGAPLAQTRPGRPTPGAKLHVRLASSNALKLSDGRDHVPTQRKTRARWSTFQNAPYSQPRA